jgi:hypothetical protein
VERLERTKDSHFIYEGDSYDCFNTFVRRGMKYYERGEYRKNLERCTQKEWRAAYAAYVAQNGNKDYTGKEKEI